MMIVNMHIKVQKMFFFFLNIVYRLEVIKSMEYGLNKPNNKQGEPLNESNVFRGNTLLILV